ncbi:MAG: hypothetical protein ACREGI_03150 [Candidatus Levyibacteriota bacterium]
MGKHRKTREQKIITELRRKLTQTSLNDLPKDQDITPVHHEEKPSHITYQFSVKKSIAQTATTPYLFHDLQKTIFLSLAVIAAEIILFTFLRNHIISLPFIGY